MVQKKAYKYHAVPANGTSALFTSDLIIMVDDVVTIVGEAMSLSGI